MQQPNIPHRFQILRAKPISYILRVTMHHKWQMEYLICISDILTDFLTHVRWSVLMQPLTQLTYYAQATNYTMLFAHSAVKVCVQ